MSTKTINEAMAESAIETARQYLDNYDREMLDPDASKQYAYHAGAFSQLTRILVERLGAVLAERES